MAPLEIVLDPRPGTLPGASSSTIYTAGDVVSGHVRVAVSVEAVKQLSIEFTGALRVGLLSSNGRLATQNSTLFRYSFQPILTRSPTGAVSNFAFTVPSTILVTPGLPSSSPSSSSSSSSSAYPAPRHVPPVPQALLPSFSYGGNPATPSHNHPAARIEYAISAAMDYKSTIFVRRDSKTVPLAISAATPTPNKPTLQPSALVPIEHICTLQSPRLRPGMEHHTPSPLERISAFFTPPAFGDPKLLVALRADLPTALTLGQPIPASISLNLLPESRGIDTPPRIQLTRLLARLMITTDFAVGATASYRSIDQMQLCERPWGGRSVVLEYGDARRLDVSELLSENFMLDAGNQLMPTFATPCLRRRYALEVGVTVECVGEKWERTFETEISLLPAVTAVAGPSANEVLVQRDIEVKGQPPNAIQVEYDGPPPSYSE